MWTVSSGTRHSYSIDLITISLTALLPASDAVNEVSNPNSMGSADMAKLAAEAAAAGAASTAKMKKAAMGRASYVDQARLVDCDPGAKAVAAWMAELERALRAK